MKSKKNTTILISKAARQITIEGFIIPQPLEESQRHLRLSNNLKESYLSLGAINSQKANDLSNDLDRNLDRQQNRIKGLLNDAQPHKELMALYDGGEQIWPQL